MTDAPEEPMPDFPDNSPGPNKVIQSLLPQKKELSPARYAQLEKARASREQKRLEEKAKRDKEARFKMYQDYRDEIVQLASFNNVYQDELFPALRDPFLKWLDANASSSSSSDSDSEDEESQTNSEPPKKVFTYLFSQS
jgi:hypothetical protein